MSVPTTQAAIALLQQGDVAAAADAFARVLLTSAGDALAHAGLGHCLLRLGREDDAWRSLTTACRLSDSISQAFSDLAWLAVKRGDVQVAQESVQRALALNSSDAKAHFMQAQLLFQHSRFDEAEQAFARAENLNARFIDARYNLGNRVFAQGDFIAATRHYQAYTQKRPGEVEGWINLGLSLGRAGELARARVALERAVALAPALAKPAVLLGLVLRDSDVGDAELIPVLKRAAELSPDAVAMHLQLACSLFNTQDFRQARFHLQRVRELDPENLAARWLEFQMPDDVIALNEDIRNAFLARWRQGIAHFEQLDWEDANVRRQASETITSATSFYLAYLGEPLVAEQIRNASVLRRLATAAGWTRNEVVVRPVGRKRRKIAVLASSLIARSTGLVWSPAFLALDPAEFELAVFCPGAVEDAMVQRWHARGVRVESGKRSVDAWIDALHAFTPDVVIFSDLGMHRILQALACVRHAPVQATTWAHPMTSGMSTIDYYLSADACEPDDAAAHYSETLVRLPRLGACLELPESIATSHEHKARDGLIRLLCVQSADKLHCGHDALFAQILKATPSARLDILCGKPAKVADALAARLRASFARDGIDFDARCQVHPGQTLDLYHGLLAQADACLDSLDFSGCLTSLDSLWHGLPIVTLPGALMRGRQTRGMLRLLGLDELIAHDPAGYVCIATRLAQDAEWRNSLSARIHCRKTELYRDSSTVDALAEFLRTAEPRGN